MIAEKAVDFFAMDIKTSLSCYEEIVGAGFSVEEIKKSKEIIQNSGLPYEFRTTAVKGKHTAEIFEEIGEWLKGAEAYFIQNFRNKKRWPKNTKRRRIFSGRIDGIQIVDGKICQKLRDKNLAINVGHRVSNIYFIYKSRKTGVIFSSSSVSFFVPLASVNFL